MERQTKYSKLLSISVMTLIIFNIILAVIIPFLISQSKEQFTFLFVLQRMILIPITSFVMFLLLIDFLTNYSKNKKKVLLKRMRKKNII